MFLRQVLHCTYEQVNGEGGGKAGNNSQNLLFPVCYAVKGLASIVSFFAQHEGLVTFSSVSAILYDTQNLV